MNTRIEIVLQKKKFIVTVKDLSVINLLMASFFFLQSVVVYDVIVDA